MKLFGPFRLDSPNHCLWRGGERAVLTPKAFDVLRYLVEHSDRLVTQEELLEALWPETYVNPEGIRKYILEIRKVLGDPPGQPLFIKTFPKRGYRFIASVTDDRTLPRLDPKFEPDGGMVGRDAGLSRLDDCLQRSLVGARQVVFVTGEAGIGKTTLLDAFQRQVIRRGDVVTMRGQCIEGFGGREAYYPVLEAVGSLLRGSPGGVLVPTFGKQAPTWLIQFPALLESQEREFLEREIFGSTRDRMLRELCEALETITAKTPMLLILEDLHWVDPSTLDLISALARRREAAKLLVIGTFRPVDLTLSQSPLKTLKQDLLVRHLCHEIAIEGLEESDVAEYLTRRYSVDSFPRGLSNVIHHNSGGNPLFMTAILQEMENKGLIVNDSGRLTLAAPLEEVYPGIPETLQRMLELQLGQLSSEEQRILQSGSVAGERFSVSAAAVMLESAPAWIEEVCDRLASRQLFIRSAGIHKAQNGQLSTHFEFRHSLYRQALYRRLTGPSRSRFHRAMGEHLMPFYDAGRTELASELALHFEEGREYEKAARCLMKAAENATGRFAYRDSIQILNRALELVPSDRPASGFELQVQILQRIGDAQYVRGEMSDSMASYEAAAECAAQTGLPELELAVLMRLALPAWHLDHARGNQICERAIELSLGLSDPVLLARAQSAAASFRLVYDAWREEDARLFAQARETIERSGSSVPQEVFSIYVVGIQGDYNAAQQMAEALIHSSTDPTAHMQARGAKGFMTLCLGRFGELLRILRAEQALAEKNNTDPWIWNCGESWLCFLCYDFDGVRRLSAPDRGLDEALQGAWTRAVAKIHDGYAKLLCGDFEEASRCFDQVRDLQITPKFFLHWHWRMHAELGAIEARLAAGDLENASREADGFLASALSVPDPNMRALAWEVQARVARARQRPDRARDSLEKAFAIMDDFDLPLISWQVHRTAWDLNSDLGNREKAERHRTQAKEQVLRIADSFEADEPLRKLLLTAQPVRRIFEEAASA